MPVTQKTIIVVEDDSLTAGLVADIIQTMGHAVETVASVQPALDLAQSSHPAAMLVDVNLGAESGLELMAQLGSDPRTASIPVVAMTAPDGPEAGAALERAGAVALLEKPFSAEDIIALVTAVVATGPK